MVTHLKMFTVRCCSLMMRLYYDRFRNKERKQRLKKDQRKGEEKWRKIRRFVKSTTQGAGTVEMSRIHNMDEDAVYIALS